MCDMLPKAAILSCAGLELSTEERDFFKEHNPLGFILFSRNIKDIAQAQRLVDALKDSVGRDAPILIDQEGGRVQRIKEPLCRPYKPAKYFGDMYEANPEEAVRLLCESTVAMAHELASLGINVNCVPVLDVLTEKTHEIIGDRSYSTNPEVVAKLGKIVGKIMAEKGVTPVVKHLPGHGRAASDSHLELPRVNAGLSELERSDFIPFKDFSRNIYSWGMTAHIIFEAIDGENPITLSAKGIKLIRENIGFKGFLLTDDISMKALSGNLGDLSMRALTAGCDAVLYCWAKMEEMEEIMKVVPCLTQEQYSKTKRSWK